MLWSLREESSVHFFVKQEMHWLFFYLRHEILFFKIVYPISKCKHLDAGTCKNTDSCTSWTENLQVRAPTRHLIRFLSHWAATVHSTGPLTQFNWTLKKKGYHKTLLDTFYIWNHICATNIKTRATKIITHREKQLGMIKKKAKSKAKKLVSPHLIRYTGGENWDMKC